MKILQKILIGLSIFCMAWALIGIILVWSPLKYVAEKAPDCENSGHIAYYKDWLGRCYIDKNGETLIDRSEIVDLSSEIYSEPWENGKTLKDKYAPFGHTLTKVEGKKATCLQDGLLEHYYCERCNSKFSDATCSTKIEYGKEIIPKPGHLGNEKSRCKYSSEGEHEYFCERADCPGTTREMCSGVWSKPLDCTKGGDVYRKCDVCENIEIKHLDAQEWHNWSEWKIEIPAACTVGGSKIRYCQDCKQTETAEISPTGHTPDSGRITTPPTCVDQGEMTYYCTECRQICDTRPVPATGKHTEDEGQITKTPTCSTFGEKTYHCSVCKKFLRSEKVDKLPHTPDNGRITKTPTCAEKGTKTYYCTKCGEVTNVEDIPATGKHTESVGVITRPPTCSLEGEMSYSCSVCGALIRKESIGKVPHTLDSGRITQSPTCVDKGTKTYYCTKCHQVAKTEDIPATGIHTEDNGRITKSPTCSSYGEKTYRCVVCDRLMRTEIIQELLPHTPNSGIVTKPATCADEGEKTYSCRVCGAFIRKEKIDKLPHTYTISEKYWLEPQYEGPTKDLPAKIQYSCEKCHEQFVSLYDKTLFIELGFDNKIMPEDKYTADTVVMFDEKQGCLSLNLALQPADLNGLANYSNIFDSSSKVLTIPSAYGDRRDTVKSVRIIGPSAAINGFAISAKSLNTLSLTLKNISFTAKNSVGLDLSNVANATLEIIGSVTIKGAAGKNGITAKNLTIYGDNSLTITGGNGGNGGNGTSYKPDEYDSSTKHGGAGTNGTNGGNGIQADSVIINVSGSISISGGNGGNGGAGGDGKGADMGGVGKGGNGGNGGNGGKGGSALSCTKLKILESRASTSSTSPLLNTLSLTVGSGGVGGKGGNGGHGRDSHTRDSGGNGGNGGNGGDSGLCLNCSDITTTLNISITIGKGGNAGNGGNGGKAFRDSVSGSQVYIGNGGNGGTGGTCFIDKAYRSISNKYIVTNSAESGAGGNGGAAGGGASGIGWIHFGSSGKGGDSGKIKIDDTVLVPAKTGAKGSEGYLDKSSYNTSGASKSGGAGGKAVSLNF